jgi:predicted small integral membrane protein
LRRAAPFPGGPLMLFRGVKIAFVAFVGAFGVLTGADNIIDYALNFEAVQHVLAMDTIHRHSPLMGRAITSPELQHIAYWIIIATEILYGALCLLGALRLCIAWRRDQKTFDAAKSLATLGIALGFALYFFGFLVIAGEWFQMWQSSQWNAQPSAFRCLASIALVLIVLHLPDPNSANSNFADST